MASILDVTMLSHFSQIFVFLFVFVVVFALLKLTKVLGPNVALMGLFALAVGILFMFNEKGVDMITFMIPWFVILGVVILLILMNYRILGGDADVVSLLSGAGKHKTIVMWIIILSVIIVIMGVSKNYGQSVGPYLDGDNTSGTLSGVADVQRGDGAVDTGDFRTNVGATLFHPKVLGMVLILVIASFAMLFLVADG